MLSIQPLVENAVKHGIAPLPDGGLVRIEARPTASGALEIRVRDTGSGFAKPGAGGIGLENVARRLELCYGPDARLDIQSSTEGTEVSFRHSGFPDAATPGRGGDLSGSAVPGRRGAGRLFDFRNETALEFAHHRGQIVHDLLPLRASPMGYWP